MKEKIFLFAKDLTTATKFAIDNDLKESKMLYNETYIRGIKKFTLFLIDDFYNHPSWKDLALELNTRINVGSIKIIFAFNKGKPQ